MLAELAATLEANYPVPLVTGPASGTNVQRLSAREADARRAPLSFPLIQISHVALAGKITGMLLELDDFEIIHLVEDPAGLALRVDGAVKVA